MSYNFKLLAVREGSTELGWAVQCHGSHRKRDGSLPLITNVTREMVLCSLNQDKNNNFVISLLLDY